MINVETRKCEEEIQISTSRMKIANEAQHKKFWNIPEINSGIGTQVC